jgi:hypothetical protein
MNWEVLILPVVIVAVWIIGTVLRGRADEKERPARSAPREEARRRPDRVTDLDRFMREVKRRRQVAEREDEDEEPAEAERAPRRAAPPRREMPPPPVPVPILQPVEVVEVVEPVVPVAPPVAAPVPRAAAAPVLAGLKGLLTSRDGLRVAVILQEVLGPPLSRRRRP